MKGVVNMYQQYQPNYHMTPYKGVPVNQDDRLIGGLALPFLLGGVAGAAVAPAFYRPYPMPYYPPYPMYRPFYRPFY